ncbi:MAG: hypothetical protein H7Y42_15980 [Chitinophagaceae bacterium]|nr:hypothetical protein [Chitinophagaceae bacterium]
MKIKNINGLSAKELQKAVDNGSRFVYYAWTISAIILTFKRTSGVYMVHAGESKTSKGYRFTLLSFLFGWWGIPSGPKHTLASIRTNLKGGKDVTDEVMSVVTGYALYEEHVGRKKK